MVRLSTLLVAVLAAQTVSAVRIDSTKIAAGVWLHDDENMTGTAMQPNLRGLGEDCDWGNSASCPEGMVCSAGGKCWLKIGETCPWSFAGTPCANQAYGRSAGIRCSRKQKRCCVEGVPFTMDPNPHLYAVINNPSDCCSGKIWNPKDYTDAMREKDSGKGYCKKLDVEPYLLPLDRLPDGYEPPPAAAPKFQSKIPGEPCDWADGASCPQGMVCSAGKCWLRLGESCTKHAGGVFGDSCAIQAYGGRGGGIKCSKSKGSCCVKGMPYYVDETPEWYAVVNDPIECCSGQIWDPQYYTPPMKEKDSGKGYCKDPKVMPDMVGLTSLPAKETM